MQYFVNLVVSVVAGLIVYYFCKWLDRDEMDD